MRRPAAERDCAGTTAPDSQRDAGVDVLSTGFCARRLEVRKPARVRGYDVDTKRSTTGGLTSWNSSAANGLSDYDVVVIPVPRRPVARPNRMRRRIRQNGGSLFVVGDWTSPLQGHAGELNDITDPYGLHVNGESDKWLRNIQDPTPDGGTQRDDCPSPTRWATSGSARARGEYDGVSINSCCTDNGTQAPLLYGDSDPTSTLTPRQRRSTPVASASLVRPRRGISVTTAASSPSAVRSRSRRIHRRVAAEHQQTDTRPFLVRTVSGWPRRATSSDRTSRSPSPASESRAARRQHGTTLRTRSRRRLVPSGGPAARCRAVSRRQRVGLTTDQIGVAEFAFNNSGRGPSTSPSSARRNRAKRRGSRTALARNRLANVSISYNDTVAAKSSDIDQHHDGKRRRPAPPDQRFRAPPERGRTEFRGAVDLAPWLGNDRRDALATVSADTLDQPWAALTGDRVSYGVWGGNGSSPRKRGPTTWDHPWSNTASTPAKRGQRSSLSSSAKMGQVARPASTTTSSREPRQGR